MTAAHIGIVPPRPISPLNFTAAKGMLRMTANGLMQWDGRDWLPAVLPSPDPVDVQQLFAVSAEAQTLRVDADAAVLGNLAVTGTVSAAGKVLGTSSKRLVGQSTIIGVAETPASGAETALMWFPALVPIVAGNAYALHWEGSLSRSDSAADLLVVQFRVNSAVGGTVTGTTLRGIWKVLPASLVGDESSFKLMFYGAAADAAAVGGNIPPQVAAGQRNFSFTLKKNSGTANTATARATAAQLWLEDYGPVS